MKETSEQRISRIRREANDKELCQVCGLLRINVAHEPDPDNAPEGKDYYDAMRDKLHAFVPSGRRQA